MVPDKGNKRPKISKSKADTVEVKQPSNVLPNAPGSDHPKEAVLFLSPAEFHKGISLVLLTELSEAAIALSDMLSKSKNKEKQQKVALKLKKWLPLYASGSRQYLAQFNNRRQHDENSNTNHIAGIQIRDNDNNDWSNNAQS